MALELMDLGLGSVGLYAIQLAHLAGYKVVTTASTKNHELCKSLGADVVVDVRHSASTRFRVTNPYPQYKDPNAVSKIKEVTHNSIHAGLDATSEADTQKLSVQTFGPGSGKLVTILPVQEEAQRLRPDVELQITLLYTALGRPVLFARTYQFPASEEDRVHMAQFLKKTSELVKNGQIKPNPTKLFDGGLKGINAGFKYMIDGKVSGEKIVYRLSD